MFECFVKSYNKNVDHKKNDNDITFNIRYIYIYI